MPHLYFNKRYWRIAGDELFMPLSCSVTGRLLWTVLLILLVYLDFNSLIPCESGGIIVTFLLFSLLLFTLAFIFDVFTMLASLKGTIVDSYKRTRSVAFYMYGRIIIGYMQAICACLGIIGLAFNDPVPCGATVERSNLNRVIFSVIIFSQFVDVSLLLCCFFCLSLPREEAEEDERKIEEKREGEEEDEEGQKHDLSPSNNSNRREAQVPPPSEDYEVQSSTIVMVEQKVRDYMRSFQFYSCNLYGGGNTNEDMSSVAKILTDIFHHEGFLDIVPSDIIAGILLVRIEQRCLRETVWKKAKQDKAIHTEADHTTEEGKEQARKTPRQYIAILPKGTLKLLSSDVLHDAVYRIDYLKTISHVFTYAGLIYAQLDTLPDTSTYRKGCLLAYLGCCGGCCYCTAVDNNNGGCCCCGCGKKQKKNFLLPTHQQQLQQQQQQQRQQPQGQSNGAAAAAAAVEAATGGRNQGNVDSCACCGVGMNHQHQDPSIWLYGGYWLGQTYHQQQQQQHCNKAHLAAAATNTTPSDIASIQGINFIGRNRSTSAFSTLFIPKSEMIFLSTRNDMIHKPYAIFLDHGEEEVILTIRGSLSIEDCITDVSCDPVELIDAGEKWGFNGQGKWAHSGMLRAALAIRQEIEDAQILYKIYGKTITSHPISHTGISDHQQGGYKLPTPFFQPSPYAHYKLILTGHSLGAGAAIILAMLLYPLFPFLHCYVYGTPGSVLDAQTCIEVSPYVTSIILGNDFISRLSFRSICQFRNDILDAIARAKVNKMIIMQSLFREMNTSEVLYPPGEEPSSSFQHVVRKYQKQTQIRLAATASMELFLPGKIIHLIKASVEHRWYGKYSHYRFVEGGYEDYTAIPVSRSMVSDHMPEYYQRELHRLYTWRMGIQKEYEVTSNQHHKTSGSVLGGTDANNVDGKGLGNLKAPHEVYSPVKHLPELISE